MISANEMNEVPSNFLPCPSRLEKEQSCHFCEQVNTWMKLLLCRFLFFFNGKVVLWHTIPNYQEAVPAGHNAGFVHSLLPLTFSPSRIIKQNELSFVALLVFFFWNCRFFHLNKYRIPEPTFQTQSKVMSVCQLQPLALVRLSLQGCPAQQSPAATIWKHQPHHVRDIKMIHSNPARLHFKESFQFAVVGMT